MDELEDGTIDVTDRRDLRCAHRGLLYSVGNKEEEMRDILVIIVVVEALQRHCSLLGRWIGQGARDATLVFIDEHADTADASIGSRGPAGWDG